MNNFFVVCNNVDERKALLNILDQIGYKWSAGEGIDEFSPPDNGLYIHVYPENKIIRFARRNVNGDPESPASEIIIKPINYLLRR